MECLIFPVTKMCYKSRVIRKYGVGMLTDIPRRMAQDSRNRYELYMKRDYMAKGYFNL